MDFKFTYENLPVLKQVGGDSGNDYAFIGEHPGDNTDSDTERLGFAIVRKEIIEGQERIGVYGIDMDGKFNDGTEDALDYVLSIKPELIREYLRLDTVTEYVLLEESGEDYFNDAHKQMPNGLIAGGKTIVVLPPSGGGGGGDGGGEVLSPIVMYTVGVEEYIPSTTPYPMDGTIRTVTKEFTDYSEMSAYIDSKIQESKSYYRDNDYGWTRSWVYEGNDVMLYLNNFSSNTFEYNLYQYMPYTTALPHQGRRGSMPYDYAIGDVQVWADFKVTDRGYVNTQQGLLINFFVNTSVVG